ncbi:MAG: hypothetical protein ACRES9_09725 [Gammaproteobacteria bacterium]
MRAFLLFCLVATGIAATVPTAAATMAADSASTAIIIPTPPTATTIAAFKEIVKKLQKLKMLEAQGDESVKAPPGVLKFAAGETNRQTSARIGRIVTLYAAKPPKGRKGHLIVVSFPNTFPATSVVQADSRAFTLHPGEQVVVVRSPMYGWSRVLPYNGPKPAPGH